MEIHALGSGPNRAYLILGLGMIIQGECWMKFNETDYLEDLLYYISLILRLRKLICRYTG